jgi:hypothetical protein
MLLGNVANSKAITKKSIRTKNPQSKEKRRKYDDIGGPPWIPARANVFLGNSLKPVKPITGRGINPRKEILKQESMGRSRGHAFTILARKAKAIKIKGIK